MSNSAGGDSLRQSNRIASMQPSLIRELFDARRATSLNLGLGQPSIPVNWAIIEAGVERLSRGDMGYTANAGAPRLRELIARHYGLAFAPSGEHVVVTCGAQEAILSSFAAILDVGDEVLIPDPGFPGYAMSAALLGCTVRAVKRRPERNFRLDVKDIEESLSEVTKAIVVNSPSNPTGAVDESRECERLARLADDRGLTIVSDEIYADISFQSGRISSPAHFGDRTIVIGGLSKNCAMTGFRLGYLIAHSRYVKALNKAHATATTCASIMSQNMAEFIFEDPAWLTESLPMYRARRKSALDTFAEYLPSVPLVEPEGGFYLFANFSQFSADSLAFAKLILREVDVVTAPGSAFGAAAAGWLRLSFAGEPDEFREAIRRIATLLPALSA